MFINLVRLNLIRLFKSRATIISTVIFTSITVFYATIFYFLAAESFRHLVLGETDVSTAYIIGSMFLMFGVATVVPISSIIVVFAVCDYYKFRQMINIEGACRSTTKFCLSEVTAIGLFSFVGAIIPIIFCFIGNLFDTPKLKIFTEHTSTLVSVYFYLVLAVFSFVLPVYAISKMFRKKIISIVIVVLTPFIFAFLYGFLKGLLDGIGISFEELFFPAFSLVDIAMGEAPNLVFSRIMLAIVLENLFWLLVAIIASRRKSEL